MKASQIDKALASFHEQKDIIDRCIAKLEEQRATPKPTRTRKAKKATEPSL